MKITCLVEYSVGECDTPESSCDHVKASGSIAYYRWSEERPQLRMNVSMHAG